MKPSERYRQSLVKAGQSEESIKASCKKARAKFDGKAPAMPTLEAWLKTLTESEQNELLGSKKARLFRAGPLQLYGFG